MSGANYHTDRAIDEFLDSYYEEQGLQSLFDRFATTARKEGVTQVSENGRYDHWTADLKLFLAPPRP